MSAKSIPAITIWIIILTAVGAGPVSATGWEVNRTSYSDADFRLVWVVGFSEDKRYRDLRPVLEVHCTITNEVPRLSLVLARFGSVDFRRKGSIEIANLRYRLGLGPIRDFLWRKEVIETDGKFPDIVTARLHSISSISSKDAVPEFIKTMMEHDAIYIELDLTEDFDAVAKFDLSGFAPAAETVLDACNDTGSQP